MKKMLCAAVLLGVVCAVVAQEPMFKRPKSDSTRVAGYQFPDSLMHLSPWKPEFKTMTPPKARPVVSMSSVAEIRKEHLPARVTVINNNTLRLGRHFTLSNGQTWANGPFPDAFLDARTLSFPMMR